MRVNNYRGMVNDRPLDTMVTRSENHYPSYAGKPFMENLLAHVNNHGTVPMRAVENIYDKGLAA